MALVAINAVVNVSIHVRVAEVVRVSAAMAIRALEDRVIARILVTGGAYPIGIAVIRREPRVVKRRLGPVRRVMTRCTGCRETRRLVVRIRGARVIGLVARVAVRRHRRVVVVDVAAGARRRRMLPG